ncbi:NAD dependent epimerase/dehydratase family protein [Besnoitia besnoiti]|uniref:NAD dependent epimerase/dehydratase family protein n=1 Tax=Besnoitia besnoiti TaxID=94643 RepID=A0A2A9MJ94_BESBE|nr:NAD dependent epimerase/dehydratase family protein [Besnoitia besnoiti]PFH35667.1 NAD dependent epimerase/dehydratase family protein [Besnoitia besnoiti]
MATLYADTEAPCLPPSGQAERGQTPAGASGEKNHSAPARARLPPQRVLVLGGTAFIGRTVARRLHEEGYQLVFVNRGRSYWGSKLTEGAEHHRADRRDAKAFEACLDKLTEEEKATQGRSWLAVVDFSAYKPSDIQAALNGLRGRYGLYVYISSDSVYEVSDADLWKRSPSVTESHAVRPTDAHRASILRRKDRYGHNKLAAEELLRDTASAYRRPVVALRLADVIGPFDDTDRFWAYFWWTQVASCHPVLVEPSGESQRMNLTFSEDVARAVSCLLGMPLLSEDASENVAETNAAADDKALDERNASGDEPLFSAYNLACEETVTLVEFLNLLHMRCALHRSRGTLPALSASAGAPQASGKAKEAGDALVWRIEEDCLKCPSFLPSVCRLTPLSMAKIRKELNLAPTPVAEAVNKTCDWTVTASRDFPKEAADAVKTLPFEVQQTVASLFPTLASFLPRSPPSSSSSSSSSSSDESLSDEEK